MYPISVESVGADLEMAYARLIGGFVTGGLNDHGVDVTPCDSSVPAFQVKSSCRGAIEFLANSLRFRRFIPICIGQPPATRAELVDAILLRGGWVGYEITKRDEAYRAIALARIRAKAA